MRVLRYSAHFPGNMPLVRAVKPDVIVHSDTLVSFYLRHVHIHIGVLNEEAGSWNE